MSSDTPVSTVTKTTKRTPDSLTKRKLRELLKGVIAFVDVRLEKRDASDCVATEMTKLGATVVENFLPEVTHLVFFEGYRRSYKTALRRKIRIVAPHWISDSKANLCKQDESKYIPDMPPPKEEIPFFRKRKFKPMVEEIVAGTYVPVDNRDANYYAERLTLSAPRKANSKNGTPRSLKGTPKTGGGGRKARKKIQDASQKSLTESGTGDLRKWFNYLDFSNSEELGKVIAESLKAIQEKNKTDPYNLWVDSPATTAGGHDDDDDEEAYVPLFERCRAKLLAEQRIKPPSKDDGSEITSGVTPPSSDSNDSPTTPCQQILPNSRGQAQVLTENNDGDVSKEVLANKKRRASVEPRANKKLKLDETSNSDKALPLSRKKNGSPASKASKVLPNSVKNTTIPESKPTCPEMNDQNTKDDNDELPTFESLNIVTPKPTKRRRTLANFKVTTEDSDLLRSSSKTSSKFQTPSAQPTRKSSRLSMRVQISLDRFLEPREKNDTSNSNLSKPEVSNSKPDISNSVISGVGGSSDIAPTSSDLSAVKENTCPSLPGKLASTNLHQWEQDFLKSTLENIGGFKMVDGVDDAWTVVVSGSARRTMKILFGIALGCWIVSLDWVIESAKRGQWVCVRDFEVAYFPAALESRKKRMDMKEGNYSMNLFSRCNGIYVSNGCQPSKKEVELLVTICGGKIMKSFRGAEVCIGERIRKSIKNVDAKWVLDSVTSNRCLDLEPYSLI